MCYKSGVDLVSLFEDKPFVRFHAIPSRNNNAGPLPSMLQIIPVTTIFEFAPNSLQILLKQ